MSEPNSPLFPNDKVFRFISDPGHKENLSGRVRAACLTCRRKKIKCSGEPNCRTCREKGLICDGFPERKKPNRDAAASIILNPIPAGIDRKRRISPPRKTSSKQQSLPLKAADAAEDSGYASTQPEIDSAMSPTADPSADAKTNPRSIDDVRPQQQNANSALPKKGFKVDSWSLHDQQNDHTEAEGSNPSVRAVFPVTQPAFAPPTQTSFDWFQISESDQWWANGTTDDPPDLISAAKALEDQAQALRQIANRQTDVYPQSRRQTVAFPMVPPGTSLLDNRYEMMQPGSGAFDDLALLLASRTPSGLTPNVTEFSSWWDINGDITDMLGQAQNDQAATNALFERGHQQSQPLHHEETSFDHTPVSQSSDMPPPQQPASSYFDNLYSWPND